MKKHLSLILVFSLMSLNTRAAIVKAAGNEIEIIPISKVEAGSEKYKGLCDMNEYARSGMNYAGGAANPDWAQKMMEMDAERVEGGLDSLRYVAFLEDTPFLAVCAGTPGTADLKKVVSNGHLPKDCSASEIGAMVLDQCEGSLETIKGMDSSEYQQILGACADYFRSKIMKENYVYNLGQTANAFFASTSNTFVLDFLKLVLKADSFEINGKPFVANMQENLK